MPLGFINDMAAVAVQIEADERLGVLMDTAAATGNLKKRPQRAHIRNLRRQAMGRTKRSAHKVQERSGAAEASVDVASFGIQVVYVNPAGEEVPRPESVIADG